MSYQWSRIRRAVNAALPQVQPLEPRRLLSTVSFSDSTSYGVGSSLGPVVVDLNGDGHPDVVSPNSESGASDGVSVYLNSGSGALVGPTAYTTADASLTGLQPYALATGDFNGDGHADIASANYGSGTLSILFGDGNGALGNTAVYTSGSTSDGIAVGDLNGDGHPDVVVANRGDNDVSVFLNNGDGTFAAAVTYAAGVSPNGVAIGDLNGDGHPDIVAAAADSNALEILINNGNGTFGAASGVSLPGSPDDVQIADLNGDNIPDLISTTGGTTPEVEVETNSGNANFASPTLTAVDGGNPINVAVADFNGDGHPDVAISNFGAQSADVFINNGDGTLQADQFFGTGLSTWGIATGDLNGDGLPDLVTGSYTSGSAIAVNFNTTNGSGGGGTTTPTKSIGGLDPSFGTNGLASHNVGFNSTTGVATDDLQSVLIGPSGTVGNQSFGLTRYNADGSLDTSFGSGGVTTTSFGSGIDAVPTAVKVLLGGDLLVAGTATSYTNGAAIGSQFAVAEYDSSGHIVSSFGTDGNGEVLIHFSVAADTFSNDVLNALAVSSTGIIYVGGSTDGANNGGTDFAIAALTSAGVLETGFFNGGAEDLNVAGGDDVLKSLAIQSNGDVVAAGNSVVNGVSEVSLARLLPNGALDKKFNGKGVVTSGVGGVYDSASSVVIQPKGQIVIGGLSATGSGSSLSSDFLVQRYTATGKLDRTFGSGGTVTTSFGQPSAVTQVALQADGSIIASGKTSSTLGGTLDVAIARYTTRGALDTSFNTTGKVVIDLASGVVATPGLQSQLAAAASTLGAEFDAFTSSLQGVVAVTQGGEILTAGSSGANTVEAELIAAGVDLVAKVLSAFPASVLGGVKGKILVSITESGTTAAKGTVTIQIQFATNASGAGATDAQNFNERVSLKQGQTKPYKINFTYPNGVSGGYFLLATVNNGAGVPSDLNANNNTAAAVAATTIAPAFVTLAGSGLSSTAIVAGKLVTFTITITNDGNVTAKGKTEVDFYLSNDETVANGSKLGFAPLTISLPAGKAKTYRLKTVAPSTIAAGTFNLLGVIDPSNVLGSDDVLVTGATPIAVG